MKILHTTFSLKTGGTELLLVDMLNHQSIDHDVSLIIVNDFIDENVINKITSKVNIVLLKRKPGQRSLFKLLKLIQKVWQIHADIVHCHNHNIISVLLTTPGKKILTLHRSDIRLKPLYLFDKLVAISPFVKKDVEERSNNRLKPVLIENAINVNNITVKTCRRKEIYQIIQIGRLNYHIKGQDILLKAIRILIDKYKLINIHVSFIGDEIVPDHLTDLQQLIKNLEVSSYVTLCGVKDRDWVYQNLHNYDLLVQPSRFEGFGLTLAEAMVAKVPCISSDIEGPMTLIGNGKYGFSFESDNAEDCAKVIYEVYNSDNRHIDEVTDAAYQNVIKNYSLTSMNDKYLNLYKQLLSEK